MSNIVPLLPAVAPLPDRVARAVFKALLSLSPDGGDVGFGRMTIDHLPDAADWLAMRRRLAAPGERAQCAAWLEIVAGAYGGVSEDDVAARERAVWLVCRDLPAQVWCEATALQVIRAESRFFPSAGCIYGLLRAHVAPLLDEIRGLEALAAVAAGSAAVILREAPPREPYVLPEPPPWVGQRDLRPPSGPTDAGDTRYSRARLPVRTPAEQVAALGLPLMPNLLALTWAETVGNGEPPS